MMTNNSSASEGGTIYANDNSSVYIGQGQTVPLSTADIADINSANAFRYDIFSYSSNNYSVYLTVQLTGTFPVPPSPPGTIPVFIFAGENIISQAQILEIFVEDACMIIGKQIYIKKDISGLTLPLDYQFNFPGEYRWLMISPGLISLNGALGNTSLNVRLFSGRVLPENTWRDSSAGSLPPDPPMPEYSGLPVAPALVPWSGNLIGYLQFSSFSSSGSTVVPTNSQIELMIRPFNQ
jgi:hypothetical protein